MPSFLVYVIKMLLLLVFISGITMALICRLQSILLKHIMAATSLLGIVIAVFIYIAKCLHPKEYLRLFTTLNRIAIVSAWLIFALAFLLLLANIFVSSNNKSVQTTSKNTLLVVALLTFSISIIPWIIHILPQLLIKISEFVAFNEESISTGTLFRFIGYVLACLLGLLTALSVFKVYIRLPKKTVYQLATLNYFVLLLDLTVQGVSSAARLGLLSSRNDLIFSIMIFEDKSQSYFAIAYGVVAFIIASAIYFSQRHLPTNFKTPAMRRKAAWWQRNCRRWAKSLLVFTLLMILSLTWLNDYITRPVKLTPPENYQSQAEQIIIDLKQVEDGHLHRFAYMHDNHNIRFIVVRKPNSNAYGVGLDACAICGIAGYFERGDTVVCKRCDVVMNKATIGFNGGCNPVPFPYEVKDGRIVINKADLAKEAKRFPIGA